MMALMAESIYAGVSDGLRMVVQHEVLQMFVGVIGPVWLSGDFRTWQ